MARISNAIVALLLPIYAAARTFTLPLTRAPSSSIRNATENNLRDSPVGFAHAGFVNLPAMNWEFAYSINVTIGTPPQTLTLIFDSGSSNIIIPSVNCSSLSCGTPTHSFDDSKSTSFKTSNKKIDIFYGTGDAHGIIGTDVLNIGGLKIENQGIGVMTTISSVITQMGNDGIIGLGPDSGAEGNLLTPLTLMYQQKLITEKLYGIFFHQVPNGEHSAVNGEITFGGIDDSKISSPMVWAPLSSNAEVNGFWGVDATIYAGSKAVSGVVSGFVDTGTTLVNVAPAIGEAFYNRISGAQRDPSSGLYKLPCADLSKLPSFTLKVGNYMLVLPASDYVLPNYENPDFQQSDTTLCLSYIQPTDSGFSFILGEKWLEHFMVGFDAGNKRLGFAPVKDSGSSISSASGGSSSSSSHGKSTSHKSSSTTKSHSTSTHKSSAPKTTKHSTHKKTHKKTAKGSAPKTTTHHTTTTHHKTTTHSTKKPKHTSSKSKN